MKEFNNLKKIPLEHVFQKANDKNCGPSCLEMVYKFKKIKYPLKKILSDFHFDNNGKSTYPPQIARHLNKHNVKTSILMSNPRALSPTWKNLSKDAQIEKIKEWLVNNSEHNWRLFTLHTLFYLQEGGDVKLKSYDVNDLKKMMDEGSMLILGLDEVWIWKHRFNGKSGIDEFNGDTHGHFILVIGYEKDKFKILDPYPTKIKDMNGYYLADSKDVLNANLIWSSSVIEVK